MQAALNWLNSRGLESIEKELHIVVRKHPSKDLYILNYHQDLSPRHHPVVIACRGLVVAKHSDAEIGASWSIVATPMVRFFDHAESAKQFNTNNFCAYEKHDGNLIMLYFVSGAWTVSSRSSFLEFKSVTAVNNIISLRQQVLQRQDDTREKNEDTVRMGQPQAAPTSFLDLFIQAAGSSSMSELTASLSKDYTYVFELCSQWNTIVRRYPSPRLYLLAVQYSKWSEYH
jgi:hypothetical protein